MDVTSISEDRSELPQDSVDDDWSTSGVAFNAQPNYNQNFSSSYSRPARDNGNKQSGRLVID